MHRYEMKLNSFKWILLIVTIIPCIKGHSCPSGYQFIYNQCVVISTQIQCPYGSILDGQRCIQPNGNCYSYCNQGYVLINNGCVPIYHQPCATACQPFTTQTITTCQPIQPITPAPCSTTRPPTPTITTGAPTTTTRTIITCPTNMVWNSTQCVRESTNNLINNVGITNVVNNKNIIHQPVNVNINNSNTVHLTTSDGTVVRIDQAGNHSSTNKPRLTPTAKELPEENCCNIISPRECTYRTNWKCNHRRHVRCGDFCTHKTICLVRGRNCSGCITDMSLCPSYCYEPYCVGGECRFYDQQEYCQEFPGSVECF